MMNPLVQKLRHGATLSDIDVGHLDRLSAEPIALGARRDIVHEGGHPRALTLILSGWACRYKQSEDGRRQIIEIFLPGDLCEPYGILPRFMDHSLGSITPITYARIKPTEMRALAQAVR